MEIRKILNLMESIEKDRDRNGDLSKTIDSVVLNLKKSGMISNVDESIENQQETSVGHDDDGQVLKFLDMIQKFSLSAAKEVKNNKEKMLDLEPSDLNDMRSEASQLNEGMGSTLAKILATGAIGLAGLSAQANEQLGQTLAKCSGDFLAISALHRTGGDNVAATTYLKMATTSINLSHRFIPKAEADRVGARQLNLINDKLRQNDKTIVNTVVQNMVSCAELIGNVERGEIGGKQQSQVAQPQQSKPGEVTNKKYSDGGIFTGKIHPNGNPLEGTMTFPNTRDSYTGKFDSAGEFTNGIFKYGTGKVTKVINGQPESGKW